MPGIDQSRQFIPLKIAVLTVSDTRELVDDKSGATLVERIEKAGHLVADRAIVIDDVESIRASGGRDLHLLPAGLARRLQGCLGRDFGAPARLPLSPLQFRRDHAAPRRASAQGKSEGRELVGWRA